MPFARGGPTLASTDAWFIIFTAFSLLWYECGENPIIFCYRIGWDVFSVIGSRDPIPAVVEQSITRISTRNFGACSNRSFTFSTRSTTLTD